MQIKFGEWLPDLPDLNNPGVTLAKNVLPLGDSYQQFPNATVYSNALTARCQGFVSTKDNSGNTINFSGNATKLYKSAIGVFSDVSKTGGYTTSDEEFWYWTRFNNYLIATNFSDAIQVFTIGSSTKFADLAASAPKARYSANIRNFLVVANTFDSVDGLVPHRVRWSALNDPTSWTVSATTQADYQDLNPDNGWIQQIIGGEYGVIFQERAINRMSYVGSPVVWQFDEVETGKGLVASGSAVKVGNYIFYLGIDGFYVFDGSRSQSISENKISRYFWNDVDLTYLSRISSTVDYDKQIIYWLYPRNGNSIPNRILCFNYSTSATKRWTFLDVGSIEILKTSLTEGYTLEQLDTVSSSLDALPFSLDSRVWTGENYILSGFNTDHKQINFNGSTYLDAVIETQEGQLTDGGRTELKLLRPLIDGNGAVTLQVGTRNKLTDSVAWGSAIAANSIGECPVRSNARYHRVRVNISGGFTHAIGVDVLKFSNAGER
jgi:hypothetical protein